jgi:gamma-glutamyltranspeptidase/glutathione hydrolase
VTSSYDDFRVHRSVAVAGTVTTARGKGAVASASREASELAVAVLKDGGNAFDAAFSLAFSLCVYHPQAGNLGGGGYLVFKEKGAAAPGAFCFREQAPAATKREAFLLPDGSPNPDKTAYGPTSVCTPGTVLAFFELQERYGKLRPRDLLLEIAKRAAAGARVTQYEADCLNRLAPKLSASPESRLNYVKGEPFKAGDVLVNPHLACTLETLAREGAAAFYRGRIAEQMVSDLRANGGFLSADDLAGYEIRESAPIGIELRGKQVWTPPPEAGGAVLLEILEVLDREVFYRARPGSADHNHYLAQAAKVAFIDRLGYLGDVPLSDNSVYQSILSRGDAERLFCLIDPRADGPIEALARAVRAGRPCVAPEASPGEHDTTHFSVVDAAGNAVSSSYSMNLRYGSKWSVAGAGFLLNGSVDAFSFVDGGANYYGVIGSTPNLFAPGKRPASGMAPVVVTAENRVEMVLGTPGGPAIPTTLAAVLLAIIGHGVSPAEAIQAGRLHHQGWPDVLYHETGTVPAELLEALSGRGYTVKDKKELIGDVHGVFRAAGSWLAVSDYRREGGAVALT